MIAKELVTRICVAHTRNLMAGLSAHRRQSLALSYRCTLVIRFSV